LKNPKSISKVYLDLAVITIGFGFLGYGFKFPYLYFFSGLALISGLHPYFARKVSKGWESIGKFLGLINSRVLLTLIFFFFITPLAFFYRLFRKENPASQGKWVNAEHETTDFTKPW
jgi:hypothetical protein